MASIDGGTLLMLENDDEGRYCPHCDEKVSKSTFYRHKTKFFNLLTKTWQLPVGIPIGLTDHEETESYAQDVQTHLRARK